MSPSKIPLTSQSALLVHRIDETFFSFLFFFFEVNLLCKSLLSSKNEDIFGRHFVHSRILKYANFFFIFSRIEEDKDAKLRIFFSRGSLKRTIIKTVQFLLSLLDSFTSIHQKREDERTKKTKLGISCAYFPHSARRRAPPVLLLTTN